MVQRGGLLTLTEGESLTSGAGGSAEVKTLELGAGESSPVPEWSLDLVK